jgi:hypothetical protein
MSRVWNAILEVSHEYESTPITEPVTLDEAKNYMRLEGFQDVDDSSPLEFDDEDDLIESIITASREAVEKFTGLHLVSKTLTVLFTNLAGGVELPGPFLEATELLDEEGDEVTDYTLIGTNFKRVLAPVYENLTMTYTAGYEADEVPKALKLAILIEVLYRYENRGEIDSLCLMAKRLAKPFRRPY